MNRTPVDSANLDSDGYDLSTRTFSRLCWSYRRIVPIPGARYRETEGLLEEFFSIEGGN